MKDEWMTSALGDVCELYQPKTITAKEMIEDGEYPVFGANGIIGRYNNFNHEEPQLLVTCRGATCGSVNVSEPKSWITGNAMVIRPLDESINLRFLEYLFRGGIDIARAITGAAQPQITRTNLAPVEIKYPVSTAEQLRIVGILDDAFEGIATAKANAEKNLQNARDLFESHLQAVFSQHGAGWDESRLGDCVHNISTGPFGSLLHKSDYEHGEIPLVNPINIEGDVIVPDARKAVGITTARRLARYALKENDVVIGRRGEIGRCAVVNRDQVGWLCGTGCFIIRPSDKTDPHYLTHLLRSGPYRRQLESVAGRATMPSISNDDLANLVIVLPPVPRQKETLLGLERLSSKTQRLETIYRNKLTALDELKKSLLHRAFNGQL